MTESKIKPKLESVEKVLKVGKVLSIPEENPCDMLGVVKNGHSKEDAPAIQKVHAQSSNLKFVKEYANSNYLLALAHSLDQFLTNQVIALEQAKTRASWKRMARVKSFNTFTMAKRGNAGLSTRNKRAASCLIISCD